MITLRFSLKTVEWDTRYFANRHAHNYRQTQRRLRDCNLIMVQSGMPNFYFTKLALFGISLLTEGFVFKYMFTDLDGEIYTTTSC